MTPTSLSSDAVRSALTAALDPAQQRFTPSPEDWRDRWIYFVMLDRFANSAAGPRHAPYDAPYVGFQGGTLEGLRQRLSYLHDLGVGAIWITPVLKNVQFLNGFPNDGTYHGYGIQDFLSVDPRFASDPANADAEFRALIDDAHAQDLYVILDIVLNHTGDVFAYGQNGSSASEAAHSNVPLPVRWRDEMGRAKSEWTVAEDISSPPPDAAVFPDELRRNAFFRREGDPQPGGPETVGDFASLKQLLTADRSANDVLIRCYQYLIARYDIDGFRIDTLKYLDPDFARVFGNAMREFALSIGKKNFFTFGEVYDNEQQIARFIGRNALEQGDIVGVDAALDFPLFYKLPAVLKGFAAPSDIAQVYLVRKDTERGIVSSHGEATRFFVTFLDNHDQSQRFYYTSPESPNAYDDQLTMALACEFALPGIPCVYYGTEQGLSGRGGNSESVREALWGKPNPFDESHPFYETLQRLARVRQGTPALRYGRFYFRPISGDAQHFALSTTSPGVLAFSRILSSREVVIAINTSTSEPFVGDVIVDASLNPRGAAFAILFTNKTSSTSPEPVRSTGPVEIQEVDGSVSAGPASVIRVRLEPGEAQYLVLASMN
jgi:glycosidase